MAYNPALSFYENIQEEIQIFLIGDSQHPRFGALGIEVKITPQYSNKFVKPKPSDKPRIEFGFLQERYGTEESSSQMSFAHNQNRDTYFQFNIAAREQNGVKGALLVTDVLQDILMAFQSAYYGGNMECFAANLEDNLDNVWYYRVVMRWRNNPRNPENGLRLVQALLGLEEYAPISQVIIEGEVYDEHSFTLEYQPEQPEE